MSQSAVQYLYARDADGATVNAERLPSAREEWAEPFVCLGCETELVAKVRGETRAKHFAHKPGTACAPETYLHRLGKEVFRETYLACLAEGAPFEVVMDHPRVCTKHRALLRKRCDHGTVEQAFDLTRYYDAVRMETRDGAFVPDLLLYAQDRPGRKLYVEIAVTHFLSEEKEASGERIVEIPIETEADVERIRERRLTEEHASFVGFQRQAVEVVDGACACGRRTAYALFIYASGKGVLKEATLAELSAWRKKYGDRIAYARLFVPRDFAEDRFPPHVDNGQLFVELLLEAREQGYDARNCFLCRYGGQSWDSFSGKGAFCKIDRVACNSNTAVSCGKWRPKDGLPPSEPRRAEGVW